MNPRMTDVVLPPTFEQTAHAGSTTAQTAAKVKCGECRWFVRNGNCSFLSSPEGRDRNRKFEHAPFWVWSDCYSDKEQVLETTETLCPTFAERVAVAAAKGAA